MEGSEVTPVPTECSTNIADDPPSACAAEPLAPEGVEPVNGDGGHDSDPADKASDKTNSKKRKRKEDKSYEYILRALSSLNSPEEKLAALCRKYADLNEETRVLKEKCRSSQKLITQVTREKEQLQNEHGKVVLAKDRLENLCREFQKQNKLISDESMNRAKEAEEKRKEVSNKFQTTLTEIRHQMNEYHTMNDKLRDENRKLSEKLKSLVEQYEQREEQMDKMYKTKELEHQLSEAKLEHATCAMKEEKARGEQEKLVLMQECEKSRERIAFLENREKVLKGEIEFYQNKYEEFQDTLTKSNEVFNNFKEEMEKMSRRLRKVEKETVQWKHKFENSNRSAIQLAEEKTKNENEIKLLRTKLSRLEELCRLLQAERRRGAHPSSSGVSSQPSDASSGNAEQSSSGEDRPASPSAAEVNEVQEASLDSSQSDERKEEIQDPTESLDRKEEILDSTESLDRKEEIQDPTDSDDRKEEILEPAESLDRKEEIQDPTESDQPKEEAAEVADNAPEADGKDGESAAVES